MKTKFVAVISILLFATAARVSAADTPQAEFQKGLIEEEANRNLDAAIQAYRSVLKQLDEHRKLAATTVFRLGECYRKLGKTNEATAQYQRVVREFGDQDVLAKLSQQNLNALSVPTPAALAKPDLMQVAMPDEETTEIERLSKMIKNSPDLVNAPRLTEGMQQTPLQRAAKMGQLAVTKFLLENGADPNSGGLTLAAQYGHKALVELLLSHGADVNAISSGYSALQIATEKGFRAVVEVLLAAKADVNTRNTPDGRTPLHFAIWAGNQGLVELLLAHRADPNAKDIQGWTSLHVAAAGSSTRLVELLLAHGADVNTTDDSGRTPLLVAAEFGSVPTSEALLKNGANANAVITSQVQRTIKPNEPNQARIAWNGFAPLHVAALMGQEPLVRLLLAHKADVNARASQERTPLNLAVTHSTPATAEVLLENGADVDAVSSESLDSPLIKAVRRQSEEMVAVIVAHKPNMDQRDQDGFTALQVAASRNWERIVELLLDGGANPNVIHERDGRTPLHWAVSGRNKRIVEALLKHNADLNAADSTGKTPLDSAKSLVPARPGFAGSQTTWSRVLRGQSPIQSRDTRGGTIRDQMVFDIIELLRQAGATEYPQRPESIMIGRGDVFLVVFRKNSHAENRYTLMEAIGLHYRDRIAGIPKNPTEDPRPSLDFPDFSQVRIHRLKQSGGENDEAITVNVEAALIAADASKDVVLQWGDMIEIPEKGHRLNETWAGLPLEASEPLRGCLSRSVEILVQSRSGAASILRTLDLLPFASSVRPPATPPVAFARGEVGGILRVASFHLDQVLHGANLLLTSSDQTRVKVTRTDPGTKQTKEIIVNLFDPTQSLWLRNGDVIIVPERE